MKKESFNNGWMFCKEDVSAAVTLPHDAMIHQNREPDAPSGSAQAYFPGGTYVYEKRFSRPDAEHVIFQFEGVYKNARVYINDREALSVAYGYIPFFVHADQFLTEGENCIRVECDNKDQPDSRWYTGAGIYRPVWMWTGNGEILEPESVQVTTLSTEPAVIRVQSGKAADISILYRGQEGGRRSHAAMAQSWNWKSLT